MSYWSFTSLVHYWPPPICNSGYAYGRTTFLWSQWGG